MLEYDSRLKILGRQLRSGMTQAEQKLWSRLRGKQVCGVQFYRQKTLGAYIVDFYGPKARLVIELDGGQHAEEEHGIRDQVRDTWLKQQELLVLRFDNLQMLNETDAVLEEIWKVCKKQLGEE